MVVSSLCPQCICTNLVVLGPVKVSVVQEVELPCAVVGGTLLEEKACWEEKA